MGLAGHTRSLLWGRMGPCAGHTGPIQHPVSSCNATSHPESHRLGMLQLPGLW